MIDEFQIKGLEKLVNSSAIKDIYPMVDKIIVLYADIGALGFVKGLDILDFDIILNDPSITQKNMYDKGLDPHYLVDYHIKNYLPYMGIDKEKVHLGRVIVWNPDLDIIFSWDD